MAERPDLEAIETTWHPNNTIVIGSKKQEGLLLEKARETILVLLAYTHQLEQELAHAQTKSKGGLMSEKMTAEELYDCTRWFESEPEMQKI